MKYKYLAFSSAHRVFRHVGGEVITIARISLRILYDKDTKELYVGSLCGGILSKSNPRTVTWPDACPKQITFPHAAVHVGRKSDDSRICAVETQVLGQPADKVINLSSRPTASVDVSAPPPHTFPVAGALLQGCSCCPVLRDAPLRAPSPLDLTSVAASASPPHTSPITRARLQGCSCCPVLRDAPLRAPSPSDPTSVAVSTPPPYTSPVARARL
jgi:hypothetical protein